MRAILAAALGAIILPAVAHAQSSGGISGGIPCYAGSSCDLGAGSLNFRGNNGLTVSTHSVGPVSPQAAVTVGPYAGASLPAGAQWGLAVGTGALENLTQDQEDTALGTLSCNQLTTGNFNTCLGLHTIGFETSANGLVAVGTDAHRNGVGDNGSAYVGESAGRNGGAQYIFAFGEQARNGNSGTITLSGTATAGDVITVNMTTTNPNVSGLPATINYTVPASPTLYSIAQGIATAINNLGVAGQGVTLIAYAINSPDGTGVVSLDFPGNGVSGTGWGIVTTATVSSGGTEVATVGTGSNGYEQIAMGFQSLFGRSLTTGTRLIALGNGVMQYARGAYDVFAAGFNSTQNLVGGTQGVALGNYTAENVINSNNFAIVGQYAGQNWTGSYGATLFGDHAGNGMTTGSGNGIFGNEDGQGNGGSSSCITTGSYNLEIGMDACVTTATSNGQLSIQNAIFGTNNTGWGTGAVSTGDIGIYQRNPGARLDVLGTGTGSELLFRSQNSTGSFVFSLSDSGIVTFTGLATGTAASYACFTSGGQLISSSTAC